MEKRTGECPVCHRQIALTANGLIRRHGSKEPGIWPPRDCTGTAQQPTTEG